MLCHSERSAAELRNLSIVNKRFLPTVEMTYAAMILREESLSEAISSPLERAMVWPSV